MLPITRTTEEEIAKCPIRQALTRVSGKWQILILLALEDGGLRFSNVIRAIGDITKRVLTENLRSLERDGYITRTVSTGSPISVTYDLTAAGRSFLEVIKPAVFWSRDHFSEICKSRKKFDERAD